jgi:hypothetical protein
MRKFKLTHTLETLQLIKETVRYPDLVDITEENWDKLYDSYIFDSWAFDCMLCESVELVKTTDSQDQYKIIAYDKSEFSLNVNITPKNILLYKLLLLKPYLTPENFKKIKDLEHTIVNTKFYIPHIIFQDSNNNMQLTGKLGMLAKSVMSGVKLCLVESFSQRGGIPNVITYQVLKTENKRIKFYEKYFTSIFGGLLNNNFIETSDEKYLEVYCWKSL